MAGLIPDSDDSSLGCSVFKTDSASLGCSMADDGGSSLGCSISDNDGSDPGSSEPNNGGSAIDSKSFRQRAQVGFPGVKNLLVRSINSELLSPHMAACWCHDVTA